MSRKPQSWTMDTTSEIVRQNKSFLLPSSSWHFVTVMKTLPSTASVWSFNCLAPMGTKETLFSCLCSAVMWAGWPFRLWNLWRRKTWKLKLLCPGVTACAFRTGLFASLGLLRNYKWCRNYKLLWMCVASWVPSSLATRLKITTSLGTSLLHPESRPRQSQIQLPKATRRANLMYKCYPSLRRSPPPPPSPNHLKSVSPDYAPEAELAFLHPQVPSRCWSLENSLVIFQSSSSSLTTSPSQLALTEPLCCLRALL